MRTALAIVGCIVFTGTTTVQAAPLDTVLRVPPAKAVVPDPAPLRADVPPAAFARRTLTPQPYRPFRTYTPRRGVRFNYYGYRLRFSSWH